MKSFLKIANKLIFIVFLGILYPQTPTAVIELEGKGISQTEASALTDRLRSELFQLGSFRVIERGLMEEILDEQGFQQMGCTSDECIVEVGNLIGVQQIIGGSISKVGDVFSISTRLINVETGEIISIITYDYEGQIGSLLKEGMRNVALKLEGEEESTLIGFGSFYITSEPSGANVWIDGNLKEDVTPLLLENIPVGQRTIQLEKENLSDNKSFLLEPGEIKRINLILSEATGGISIISEPLDAHIGIKGNQFGKTPLTISDLPVGQHLIEVSKDGFSTKEKPITIEKNIISKINIKLTPLTTLDINSIPKSAIVELNGKPIGLTPIDNFKVDPGIHTIKVQKQNYNIHTSEFVVLPDSTNVLNIELIRKTGSLQISSNPSGGRIYLSNRQNTPKRFVKPSNETIINSNEKFSTPITLTKVPTGFQSVIITLDGYLTQQLGTNIHEDEEAKLHFILESKESVIDRITYHNKKKKLFLTIAFNTGLLGVLAQVSSLDEVYSKSGYLLSILSFWFSDYNSTMEKEQRQILNNNVDLFHNIYE